LILVGNEDKPVLIIDTREKTPWNFEADDSFSEVVYEKLDGGDYSIRGLENILVIERKANVDELFNNFTKDKTRIKAEFERLDKHKFRILIVEETWESVLNPYNYYINKKSINKKNFKMPVAVVASNLTNLMLEHNVHIIFGGSKSQSMAKGILLHAWELHKKGKL